MIICKKYNPESFSEMVKQDKASKVQAAWLGFESVHDLHRKIPRPANRLKIFLRISEDDYEDFVNWKEPAGAYTLLSEVNDTIV